MNPKRTTTPGRTQRLRLCTAPARAYLYAKEAHARSTSINALRYLLRLALVSGSFPLAADAMQRDWAIGPVPQTVIDGDQPGRAPLGVIVGARRLLTGEIVVADASAVDLRLFDASGRFVRTITRRGRGPGEMTNVASLSRSNRAITAIGGMDVVAIGPDATTPVRYALPSSGGPPSGSILGVFGSGQVLLGESRFRILSPPSRVVRDTTRLVIASLADVKARRELGRFPNQSSLILVTPLAPGGLKFGRLDTAPQLEIAITDQLCWIGDSGGSELIRVDLRDDRIQRFRIPLAPRKWMDDALAQYVRSRVQGASSPVEAAFLSAWGNAEYRSDAIPAFRALHADVGNGVWIEHFLPSLAARPRYTVLSSSGQVIATTTAPRAMRLLDIGEDYVIGAEKDENDVERIALYPLRRR